MRNNHLVRVMKSFKPALIALLVLLVGVQTINAGSLRGPQTAPGQAAGLESSAEAKRALEGIDRSELKRIKNARLRAAAERTFDAMKAIADNTLASRESALLAKFDRALDNLVATQKAAGITFGKCLDSFNNCKSGCTSVGKLFCGCRLGYARCNIKASKDYFP